MPHPFDLHLKVIQSEAMPQSILICVDPDDFVGIGNGHVPGVNNELGAEAVGDWRLASRSPASTRRR